MTKTANITPRIKDLLSEIYQEHHRRIGPTAAREELLNKMKAEGLDRIFGPDFPSVSAVSVHLKKFEEIYEKMPPESKELDKPWRLVDIAKYPMPPEIVPTVLEAWGWTLAQEVEPLSIRDALWVSRLYYVSKAIEENIKEIYKDVTIVDKGDKRDLHWAFLTDLLLLAKSYSIHELTLELTGEQHPEKPEDMWASWVKDGLAHETLTKNDEVYKKCLFEYQKRFPSGPPRNEKIDNIINKSSYKFLGRIQEIRLSMEKQAEESLVEEEMLESRVEKREALLKEIKAVNKEIREIKAQGAISEEKKARLKELWEKANEIQAQSEKLKEQEEAQNEGTHTSEE